MFFISDARMSLVFQAAILLVLGEFPFQVAIYNMSFSKIECGGSILSQNYVLTSLHCVEDGLKDLRVSLIFLLFKIKPYLNIVNHIDCFLVDSSDRCKYYSCKIPTENSEDLNAYYMQEFFQLIGD
jgi:hypothetical protein